MNIRIGLGYDVHRLAEGCPLWLGGVLIPHTKGSVGHSDGDTLIHAVCDALLGATGMRDIGFHFPDTSSEYKGIDSKILLKNVMGMVAREGYSIINLDANIILQSPKLSPFIPEMKSVLAEILNVSKDDISIKAKTSEKLGFVGSEDGIEAQVALLLFKKDSQ